LTHLNSFTFSGDHFYEKETKMVFLPGITLLRGINHDAGDGDNHSNGTGKTRLPQILSSYIFNDSDRGNLKKLVTPEFKGYLDFTKMNDQWSFNADVKENSWDILKNGQKHIDHHKFSECQKFLAAELNLTRKDWSNFIHINRHSSSVCLQGTPDEKRKFLETFFNIDDYYKEKLAEYKAIKEAKEKDIEKLEQDRARYGQVLEALKEIDGREYLKTQMSSTKSFLTYLSGQQEAASGLQFKLKTEISYWSDYYDVLEKADGKPPLCSLKAKLETLQTTLAGIIQKERSQQTVSFKAKQLSQEIIPPQIPEIENPSSDEILELEQQALKMREKQRLIDKFKTLKETMPNVEVALKESLQDEFKSLLEKQSDNKLHLSLSKDGKNCTRCGQDINFVLQDEDPAIKHESLKVEANTISKRLGEIGDILRSIDSKIKITGQLQEIRAEAGKFPLFSTTITEVNQQIESGKKARQQWQTYKLLKQDFDTKKHAREILEAELFALGYPDILSEALGEQRYALVQEISETQKDLIILQKASDLLEKVASLKPKSQLHEDLLIVEEDLLDLSSRIQKLHESFGEYRTQLSLADTLHLQKDDLGSKLKDSDEIYNEYRIIQALVKFFSPAGFKMYELRKRCDLLIEKANFWSPVFFSEQYEWSLPKEVDSLEFMVQPIAHRQQAPYPASNLSSGEENRGERVLLFSQLSLAPKSLNVLFLDEIEGHLDPAGKIVFTEIVIPKLKETFKDRCIVVISHEECLIKSPHIDHLWLSERKNRKSTLKVIENYNKRA